MGESVLIRGAAGPPGGAETARLFDDAGLEFRGSSLHLGGVALSAIADGAGTPAYVYSAEIIRRQFRALDQALSPVPHRIAYAVKANANLAVLRILRDLGAGADIVSGGELARALAAGFEPERIVFSGVGKTDEELTAAVQAGIGHVHLESTAELAALGRIVARLGRGVRVGIRVNPDVTADTHPYIATGQGGIKFGVPVDQVVPLALAVREHPLLTLDTIAMHIGSQLLDARPYAEGMARLLELVALLRDAGVDTLRSLDVGGGIGIRYRDERPLDPAALASTIVPLVRRSGLTLLLEPGRYLVGSAGVLLTTVLSRKHSGGKELVIVDAGMNDLVRPSHYMAYHEMTEVELRGRPEAEVDVVGPVCETGDFLARDRTLPGLDRGERIAVLGAGAYGFVMASNYNTRPRPAEVIVDGEHWWISRPRESVADLYRGEKVAP
ncbi:MAG TPA: diaminopimelate decarboxylase [Gemmatimonadales bacterium]|jgi:diaminopimelate decarboxylase|nr:diaminopimelate decarboxylase [Gemmatimonadales bacterium]